MTANSPVFNATTQALAQAISPERLGARLDALARFGARADGGVNRQALTDEDLAARRWLVSDFAARLGYRVAIDDAANIFIRRDGTQSEAAPVLTGSHADSQAAGGRLDGAFGVVAGLEVFEALDQLGLSTTHPLEVVIWTNEEGCRFSPGLMGSLAYADPSTLETWRAVRDKAGVDFGSACDAARADLTALAQARQWRTFEIDPARPLHACIEAHIEQGPELENAALQVGCVHTIQGVRWLDLVFPGRSGHAGTTPAAARDDAMVKAIDAAHAVLQLAAKEMALDPRLRLTIGRLEAKPAAINVIACEARFTIDLRHPEEATLARLHAEIAALAHAAIRIDVILQKPPVPFDSALHALTLAACKQLALPHQAMLSGAFHDAMPLAALTPTTMLFAPSRGGLSHHPAEDTDLADLVACTRALGLCLGQLTGVKSATAP